jgi:hypothetical protein
VIGALCSIVSGCDGCDGGGGHPRDGGIDMAVPTDLAVPPGDGSVRKVSYSEFSAHYADALCKRQLACGLIDQASMAVCLERNTKKIGWDVDTDILKGRLEINEAACIDAVENIRCDQSNGIAVAVICERSLFIPHLNKGDVCLGDVECINGYCAHEGSDAGAAPQPSGCPGRCADFKAATEECFPGSTACGPDGDCSSFNPGVAGTCIKFFQIGATCDPFAAECDSRTSYCPFFGTEHKCTAPAMHAEGESCDINQNTMAVPPCAVGQYCKLAADGNSATCQKQISDGTTECVGDFYNPDCADGKLCYSLSASVANTCQKRGSNNEPCVAFSGTTSSCQLGYYCDGAAPGTPGTCKPLIADGQPCTQSYTCASTHQQRDNTCVVANSDAGTQTTCQPSKGFGESCVPGYEDSVCFPADTSGTAYCAPAANGGGVCQPKCF